jgi:hypothetical protein
MTAFADISSAFVKAWEDGGLDYPTAYEARDFTPPTDAPWCALKVLPVTNQAAALGDTAPLEHVVLAQVDINRPKGQGAGPILADADAVAALFTPGSVLTYNGMNMHVEYCDRSQIMRDGAYDVVSMTIKLRGWQHRA